MGAESSLWHGNRSDMAVTESGFQENLQSVADGAGSRGVWQREQPKGLSAAAMRNPTAAVSQARVATPRRFHSSSFGRSVPAAAAFPAVVVTVEGGSKCVPQTWASK